MNFDKTGVLLACFLFLGACGPTGSTEECSCRLTINGETKETTVCGGLLCFEGAGEYYRCGASGPTATTSCASTGGGGGATGGGGGTTGGGGGALGGGGGATGGGGGSTATCTGSFACGSSTCDAATQFCRVGCDQLSGATTYECQAKTGTSCPSTSNFCSSYIAVTQCPAGRQATCSGDSATRGLVYGCKCL